MPPLSLTAVSAPALTSVFMNSVAEERGVFLPTRGHVSFVGLDGQALGKVENSQRLPYIESYTPSGVQVRLTDWVGQLTFVTESDAGRVRHRVLVHPAKLHEQPQQAFAALGRMVDALPELGQALNFPQGLLRTAEHLHSGPLSPLPADLLALAGQAWQLWQLARRRPQLVQGHGLRVLHDGRVPDRVDWDLTLEHWGRGGFPGHVARDLAPPLPPAATSALLEVWDALIAAAQRVPQPEQRTPLLTRFAWAKAALPGGAVAASRPRRLPPATSLPATDPLTRQARLLTEQVGQVSRRATGIPQGYTRMAELYEVWALARFTEALGAVNGQFERDSSGLFTGTFQGNGVTVTLNPRLSFRGIGLGLQLLRPDLLAVFEDGRALVADVKYRPLDRMTAQQHREINDQLLRYMGLSHAATGIILWPGRAEPGDAGGDAGLGQRAGVAARKSGATLQPVPLQSVLSQSGPQFTPPHFAPDAVQIDTLPGDRARMARIRLHPDDPPEALRFQLQRLGFSGVFV